MGRIVQCTSIAAVLVLAGCGSSSSADPPVGVDSGAEVGGGDIGGDTVADTGIGDGDATADTCTTPACIRVVDLSTWKATTCAVLSEGHAFCWGDNRSGQVGDGTTTTPKLSPVLVKGLTNVVKIAAGVGHTCAILSDRTVNCWGVNGLGQLGDGSKIDRATPAPVVTAGGPLGNATQLAVGSTYSCALLGDKTVSCWGGGPGSDNTKATLVAGLTDIVAIDGDGRSICSLHATGAMTCFAATTVTPTNVAQLALGDASRCVRLSDATVSCWGQGGSGELGDGLKTDRLTPGPVPGLTAVTDLASGQFHYCAIRTPTDVVCWGNNSSHQLGDGTTKNAISPQPFTGIAGGVTRFALGDDHSCAVGSDGKIYCWGLNRDGQLGDGTGKDQPLPTLVSVSAP